VNKKEDNISRIKIRPMKIEDFEEIHELWMGIKGFSIRSVDDSLEGIEHFLERNPNTSIVAQMDNEIAGTILCGHDGRRGCLYHVCVKEKFRNQDIGKRMVKAALEALKKENISKVSLVAFKENQVGNIFWKKEEWICRNDINTYDYILNEANVIHRNI